MGVEDVPASQAGGGWNSRFPFYHASTIVGAPRRPHVVAADASLADGIQLVDWIVPDRVEVVSQGGRSDAAAKFCFYLADRTTWISRPNDAVREIPANNIGVISSTDPVRTISPENTRHLTLILPHRFVAERMILPDCLCEPPNMPARNMNVARDIMQALRSSIGIAQFSSVSGSLAHGLLDTLAVASISPMPLPLPCVRDPRLSRMNQIIAENFADPDFSAAAIARSLNISLRYLHVLCSEFGSPAKLIRQFRLSQAAALMKAPAWQGRSITDIAFACGFNSSSQFSATFKAFSGVSPRAYRRMHRC